MDEMVLGLIEENEYEFTMEGERYFGVDDYEESWNLYEQKKPLYLEQVKDLETIEEVCHVIYHLNRKVWMEYLREKKKINK